MLTGKNEIVIGNILIQLVKNNLFKNFRNNWQQRYGPIIVQGMLVTLFEEWHNFRNFKAIREDPSTEGLVDDMR